MSAIVDEPRGTVRLEIEGMTCASCAPRIERRLTGLGGVEAAVDLATEKLSVAYDLREHDVPELVAAVASVGIAHVFTKEARHSPPSTKCSSSTSTPLARRSSSRGCRGRRRSDTRTGSSRAATDGSQHDPVPPHI